MNENKRPSLEELSLYYDGQLPPQDAQRVEAWLTGQDGHDPAWEMMHAFDDAMQPDLSDDAIDQLLSNNVQEIHQKIFETERRTESGWLFFLQPKFLASAFGVFLLIAVGISFMQESDTNRSNPDVTIASNDTDQVNPSDSEDQGADDQNAGDQALRAMEEQMVLALTGYAKSALNTGYDYANKQSQALMKNLDAAQQGQPRPLALDAVRMTLSQNAGQDENAEANPAAEKLAAVGKRQVAIGVGATMLTMMNVF